MPPQNPISTNRPLALALIALSIIVLAGFVLWDHRDSPYLATFLGTSKQGQTSAGLAQLVGHATYTCDQGKTIAASYFDLKNPPPPQTTPGAMPTPTGSVSLILSDGRTMTLPQTLSASGIRYANQDESFVFWSKGNTAFVEEGANQTQTYQGCVTTEAPAAAATSTGGEMPDSGVLQ